MRSCFLGLSREKWLLEIEYAPGEDAVTVIEMTIDDSEYYINLVGKALAMFERTDFNFEINLL